MQEKKNNFCVYRHRRLDNNKYNSIAEAAKFEKISESSLIHYLKGSRKNITNLRYYE